MISRELGGEINEIEGSQLRDFLIFIAVDEQNAQTTKQVEEAVAQLSLDKSSESMSSFSRTSSSITDIEEKDCGTEKGLPEERSERGMGSSLHGELVTINESIAKVERRKSASQGSKKLFIFNCSFYFIVKSSNPIIP